MNKELPSVDSIMYEMCEDFDIKHPSDLVTVRKYFDQAITQHTADLQRQLKSKDDLLTHCITENNLLKSFAGKREDLLERYKKLDPVLDKDAWEAGGGVPAVNWAAHLIDENTTLRAQLTEAQSQLVVLREALEEATVAGNHAANLLLSNCNPCTYSTYDEVLSDLGSEMADVWTFWKAAHKAREALTTTQPTYDRIRQEWREEVIKECLEVVETEYNKIQPGTEFREGVQLGFVCSIETLQTLINKESE